MGYFGVNAVGAGFGAGVGAGALGAGADFFAVGFAMGCAGVFVAGAALGAGFWATGFAFGAAFLDGETAALAFWARTAVVFATGAALVIFFLQAPSWRQASWQEPAS